MGSIEKTENEISKSTNEYRRKKLLDSINLQHLNEKNKQLIQTIIIENESTFWLEEENIGESNVEQHEINLTDEVPVYVKQFLLPYKQREIVLKEGDKLIKNKLVQPSKSAFNAPDFIIDKKSDNNEKKYRKAVDFRKLNEKTLSDPFLLPNINEIFDEIGKNTYFSVIDITQGFHNIKIRLADVHKPAWGVHPLGRFEFLRMPFGMKNSARTFQRVINNVLNEELYKICFAYIDDIIIFSTSPEEHIKRLERVIKKLNKANLKINTNKCKFLVKEAKFLGHIINEQGLSVDEDKIRAIKKFPTPKDVKGVQSFLGVANFYIRFINKFADITTPLNTLLRKDVPFKWQEE